jgi:hypothetical protein
VTRFGYKADRGSKEASSVVRSQAGGAVFKRISAWCISLFRQPCWPPTPATSVLPSLGVADAFTKRTSESLSRDRLAAECELMSDACPMCKIASSELPSDASLATVCVPYD